MTNPLHAHFYADRAVQATVEIVENIPIARDTIRLRFAQPTMAKRVVPGQFFMVRISDCDDPLIGRALALYDVVAGDDGKPELVDVVYLVKGKFTAATAKLLPGQRIDVWGPLGNGFSNWGSPPCLAEHLIMVAGGVGQTPFVALAKESLGRQSFGDPPRDAPHAKRVTLCYGARTADYLAGLDDFEAAGAEVRVSTNDGSRGHHGLVTELLENTLDEDSAHCGIVCCGPELMMEAVAGIAKVRRIPCQVSLETPMACGIGICFSCVARVRDEDGWDYKRTCVEGPVFEAEKIAW